MNRRAVLGLFLALSLAGCAGSSSVSGSAPASSAPPASAPELVMTPDRLEIPAIGLATDLIETGLDVEGALEVPEPIDAVSWWTGSARPGQVGPAVLLGHTDLDDVGGAFARLGELQPGAEVRVGAGTQVRRFVVTRAQVAPKDAFPAAEVYGPVPVPELRLITCDGRVAGRSHVDNLIIYAREEPAA